MKRLFDLCLVVLKLSSTVKVKQKAKRLCTFLKRERVCWSNVAKKFLKFTSFPCFAIGKNEKMPSPSLFTMIVVNERERVCWNSFFRVYIHHFNALHAGFEGAGQEYTMRFSTMAGSIVCPNRSKIATTCYHTIARPYIEYCNICTAIGRKRCDRA